MHDPWIRLAAYRLKPPDDGDVVEWLLRFDTKPSILPTWPQGSVWSVVLCIGPPISEAFVLPTREAVESLAWKPLSPPWLFFTIPRSALLAGVCPGLVQDLPRSSDAN